MDHLGNILLQLMVSGLDGDPGVPVQRHVVVESNPDPDPVVTPLLNMVALIVQGSLPLHNSVTLRTVQVSKTNLAYNRCCAF